MRGRRSKGTFKFWNWSAESWSAVGAFSVLLGIGGVLLQVDDNRKRHRIEVGPYVRVDVVATNVPSTQQFDPPKPYYGLWRGKIAGIEFASHVLRNIGPQR